MFHSYSPCPLALHLPSRSISSPLSSILLLPSNIFSSVFPLVSFHVSRAYSQCPSLSLARSLFPSLSSIILLLPSNIFCCLSSSLSMSHAYSPGPFLFSLFLFPPFSLPLPLSIVLLSSNNFSTVSLSLASCLEHTRYIPSPSSFHIFFLLPLLHKSFSHLLYSLPRSQSTPPPPSLLPPRSLYSFPLSRSLFSERALSFSSWQHGIISKWNQSPRTPGSGSECLGTHTAHCSVQWKREEGGNDRNKEAKR